MIPIKDENPIRIFPFVTIGIIILNLLVFLYEISPLSLFDQKAVLLGVVPYRFLHPDTPLFFVTLFTALFIHGDVSHLLGNMIYLWVFGNNIEEELGHLRFIFFYLFCGVLSILAYVLISPESQIPLIGASGAISGVLGAYFLLYPNAKITILVPLIIVWEKVKLQAFWLLLFWILWQLYYGTKSFDINGPSQSDDVAWLVHVFGFIIGAVFIFIVTQKKKEKD